MVLLICMHRFAFALNNLLLNGACGISLHLHLGLNRIISFAENALCLQTACHLDCCAEIFEAESRFSRFCVPRWISPPLCRGGLQFRRRELRQKRAAFWCVFDFDFFGRVSVFLSLS